MKIHAAARPADDTAAEAHHWTVDCASYDEGMVEVRAGVNEGWKLLHVRVED